MQGKKYIAAALVCGFILGSSTAPAQAGILGTVLKGGAIGVLVSQFDDQLNSAINTLTGKYAVSSDYATKVVPVITVGDGSYAGCSAGKRPACAGGKMQGCAFDRSIVFRQFPRQSADTD